ncbi:MAG TPA: T9SS type A sorting domain-containing protein [Bacteroidia bacterium]|nr:T9SS type A sorting domain-containing protein [Bacteroidia bacterium]HRS58838.1 T9SS type A sorting domain-containing protein [Bacteroidia bacterium]
MTDFDRKLKSYSALAAGLVVAGNAANGQIIYTDIDPDIILSDTSYLLDMNKDSIPDFKIVQEKYFYYSTFFMNIGGVQTLNGNEALGDTLTVSSSGSTYLMFYPRPLNKNDLIDENQGVWEDSSYGLLYQKAVLGSQNITLGKWRGGSEKYLGLRFKIGNDWHYGWARLSVSKNADTVVIKDFAYESHPAKKILAGQTFSSLAENADQYVSIYRSGEKVLIFLRNNISHANGNLYNLMGESVREFCLESGRNDIDIQDLPKGIYLVRIQIGDAEISRKIVW